MVAVVFHSNCSRCTCHFVCRHFISSLASNHERQITVIPVALRGTIEEPRRAMPLAEMVLKKAHPTEVFKPLRCPRRSVAELEHQLKGVEAQYSESVSGCTVIVSCWESSKIFVALFDSDLVTVLLGKQKAGGKRPTSATASRLTLPRWQNYDDVFLHMGGLKVRLLSYTSAVRECYDVHVAGGISVRLPASCDKRYQ